MSSELLFCKKEQGSVISHGWVLQSPLTWINSQRLLAFKINSTSIRVKHIIYFIISDNFMLLWHFDNVKPRPNNHNTSQHLQAPAKRSQHITTLLGATMRLALLQRVAPCWVLKIELVRMPGCNILERTWQNDYNNIQHPQLLYEKSEYFKFEPTKPNMSQHLSMGC